MQVINEFDQTSSYIMYMDYHEGTDYFIGLNGFDTREFISFQVQTTPIVIIVAANDVQIDKISIYTFIAIKFAKIYCNDSNYPYLFSDSKCYDI